MNNAHIKLRLSYSTLLYALCIMIPIIQIINSVFLFSDGESSFGKVYRFIVLLISTFIVMKTSMKQTKWMMLLLVVNLIVVSYQVGCGVSLFDAILNMVKLLCPYVTAGAFIGLIDKGKIDVAYFDKMIRALMIIVPLSIIIPRILGIGYERYEGSGYQGLYFENNALVVVLVVTFIYSLENLYRKRNLKNLFYVSLTTFSMVINGSKSSMALFAVITVLYILRYIFVLNPTKFPLRLIAVIVAILGLGVMLYPVIYPLVEKRIDAYMYYYVGGVQVNGGTVLDFLTNGRTAFAESYFSKYYARNSMMNVLFGIQRYGEIRVEMDPIDIFLYFGVLVSVLLIVYIVKTVRNLKYASFMVKLMFWSIMIYSFLAGHVWNSSLAGLPLSMILAITMSIKKLKVNSCDDELSVKYFA